MKVLTGELHLQLPTHAHKSVFVRKPPYKHKPTRTHAQTNCPKNTNKRAMSSLHTRGPHTHERIHIIYACSYATYAALRTQTDNFVAMRKHICELYKQKRMPAVFLYHI